MFPFRSAALFVALLFSFPAAAQDAPQDGAEDPSASSGSAAAPPSPPLWLVTCANQPDPAVLSCELSQSIVLSQGNQRVATASFGRAAGAEGLTAFLTLPVGVHLPSGVAVSVDGTELAQTAFRSCDVQGCRAEAEVDADWLDAMRGGTEMRLTVERAPGDPLGFGFDLAGFGDTAALLP